jgi:predicted RNA-binding protein Jag
MKSIMQEASSIAAAIEKAWQNAHKPIHFSVKVLEEPQKNFFGFCKKSAKIALFFEEQPERREPAHRSQGRQQQQRAPRTQQPQHQHPRQQPQPQRTYETSSEQRTERPAHAAQPQNNAQNAPKILWSPDMVTMASQWLSEALAKVGYNSAAITPSINQYTLTLTLAQPLYENREREDKALRSFSVLILQTMRHKLQRPLRGFKVFVNR